MELAVNGGHPLAQGLRFAFPFTERGTIASSFGNPVTRDVVTRQIVLSGAPGAWANLVGGAGVFLSTSQSLASSLGGQQGCPPWYQPTVAASILWRGLVLGDSSNTNNPAIAGITYAGGNTNPYFAFSINRSSTGQGNLYGLWNDNGTSKNVLATSVITYGALVNYVLAVGVGAGATLYRNAVSIGNLAFTGPITYSGAGPPSGPFLTLGQDLNGTGSTNTHNQLVLGWARCLTPSEVAWLAVEPYAVFA